MTRMEKWNNELTQTEGSPQGSESPFQTDEEIAWEPLDEDLWVPYRIRGSWRGGVLG